MQNNYHAKRNVFKKSIYIFALWQDTDFQFFFAKLLIKFCVTFNIHAKELFTSSPMHGMWFLINPDNHLEDKPKS